MTSVYDNTIQYNTIQYNTIQYNTIQYNTIQYNTILFKHGKNLQFTNGKYDKLNKYKNTMNWFTRLPCWSQVNY
jgi:hypothetical protein